MLCGSKPKPAKVSLNPSSLEPISLNFNGAVLKFDNNEGVFIMTDNPFQSSTKDNKKVLFYKAEIEEIKIRKEKKAEQLRLLKEQTNKLSDDIDTMKQLLACDIMDKEYLEDLKNMAGDYRENIIETLKEKSLDVEEIDVGSNKHSVRREEKDDIDEVKIKNDIIIENTENQTNQVSISDNGVKDPKIKHVEQYDTLDNASYVTKGGNTDMNKQITFHQTDKETIQVESIEPNN